MRLPYLLPNLPKAEYNRDTMSVINDRNQIRRVMFVWGVLTLLYFFTTWVLVQIVGQNSQERIFAALATTVTYSAIALSLGQNVLRQTSAGQNGGEVGFFRRLCRRSRAVTKR